MASTNVSPGFDTSKFSLGPAVVYIGDPGTTPMTDMGSVEEISFEMNLEGADVELGGPKQLVDVLHSRVTAELTFMGMEWSLEFFNWATGGGEVDGNTYRFGPTPRKSRFALRFQHVVTGSGDTYEGRFWTVVPEGNFPLTLGESVHSFETTFRAIRSTSDWAGGSLNDIGSYLEIERTVAP